MLISTICIIVELNSPTFQIWAANVSRDAGVATQSITRRQRVRDGVLDGNIAGTIDDVVDVFHHLLRTYRRIYHTSLNSNGLDICSGGHCESICIFCA